MCILFGCLVLPDPDDLHDIGAALNPVEIPLGDQYQITVVYQAPFLELVYDVLVDLQGVPTDGIKFNGVDTAKQAR